MSSSGLPGSLALRVPFFNVLLPGEAGAFLSIPGTFSGTATESLRTDFHGAEANGVMTVVSRPSWHVEVLGGARYLRLREKYQFDTSSPFFFVPDVFQTHDEFTTTNAFIGGQLGARGEVRHGRFLAGATAKVLVRRRAAGGPRGPCASDRPVRELGLLEPGRQPRPGPAVLEC